MSNFSQKAKEMFKIEKPFAITMWEFSWIERRWPGAGYEDWDQALSELVERGYDAVRIDAFPHLMAWDAKKEWTLNPVWNLQDWGSRSVNRITLHDDFRDFLKACRRHNIRVGLSSWFRQDPDRTMMSVLTPKDHAEIWIKTLNYIKEWGEIDNILYVDMCNEWPLNAWAPFFTRYHGEIAWESKASVDWMREAVRCFKEVYPDIPVTFSNCAPFGPIEEDISFLDFLEPHIWTNSVSEYYDKVGYSFQRFDDTGYTNMALKGERIYKESKEHYDNCLINGIRALAEFAKAHDLPLVTTECWAVTDYKDWPLLNWDWILDLEEIGIKAAAETGCWAGMATSNFCGPQFVGMWREKEWHKEMTEIIHNSEIKG